MSSCHDFLPSWHDFCTKSLAPRIRLAVEHAPKRFCAAIAIQRFARGYLIRKYVAWLHHNATIIQCAFRVHVARKKYRLQLIWAVRVKRYLRYYNKKATMIQSLWRGLVSRRCKFSYREYRRWLSTVTERGENLAAEAAEFKIRTRREDLAILENEARKWLAFVVFKLHHLLRTFHVAGVFSNPATTELTEFEKLMKSIKLRQYCVQLRRKYEEFARKHRPNFNNKRLFPIIGNGEDYWYLSLTEMYELTAPMPVLSDNRHRALHHGPQHKRPFLWRKPKYPIVSEFLEGRGPYRISQTVERKAAPKSRLPSGKTELKSNGVPRARKLIVDSGGAGDSKRFTSKDPRFDLYVKGYKPEADVLRYLDFNINALLHRIDSVQNTLCK